MRTHDRPYARRLRLVTRRVTSGQRNTRGLRRRLSKALSRTCLLELYRQYDRLYGLVVPSAADLDEWTRLA
jgi:hypothetical protein